MSGITVNVIARNRIRITVSRRVSVGNSDLSDLATASGSAGQYTRVAAAGGIEYRDPADVLSDIGADPAGSAATAQAAAVAAAQAYADGLAANYDAAGSAATVASALATHEADTANPHAVTAVQAGADPAGSAAAAQAAAVAAAQAYADGLATNYDPAGSAAAVASDLASHEADTANPHSVTAVQAGADPAGSAAAAQAAAIAAAQAYADGLAANYDAAGSAATVASALATHEADTANPHAVTAVQAGADPAGSAAAAQAAAVAAAQAYTDSEIGSLGTMAAEAAADYAELDGAAFTGDVEATSLTLLDSTNALVMSAGGTAWISAPNGHITMRPKASNGLITFYSDGQEAFRFTNNQQARFGSVTGDGQVGMSTKATTRPTLVLTGIAGQSADMLQIVDSGLSELLAVSASGDLTTTGAADLADGAMEIDDVTGDTEIGGIVDYTGTMSDSTKDPTADAPADWLEIQIGGTTYYIPAYTA